MPTKEKIEAIIKELQKILRIQDWDIKLEIVNNREMDSIAKEDYIPGGSCSRNRYYKEATVYLNKEYTSNDWYYVLIHELYHIVLEDIDNFWDNEVRHCIVDDERKRMDDGYSFYIERLNCDLTRQFVSLFPVAKFGNILNAELDFKFSQETIDKACKEVREER